jgi:hypothetical protein
MFETRSRMLICLSCASLLWPLAEVPRGGGMQAGSVGANSLAVMKLSNLTCMKQPRGGEAEDEDGESSDEEDEQQGGAPVLQVGRGGRGANRGGGWGELDFLKISLESANEHVPA